MRYEAVIFDLGGTLIHSVAWSDFEKAAREVASVISAPSEDFVRLWFEEGERLGTGDFQTYQDYIRHISGKLGLTVEDNQIDLAAGIQYDNSRQMVLAIRKGAIELLTYLKSRNYKTGLISDCFTDIPAIWDDTPFATLIDVAVFSCSVGMNKADTGIFQLAADELGVSPDRCLYIADGMRNELANASKFGMNAIQIYVPGEIDDSPIREEWTGPVISSFSEIYILLE